MNAAIHIFDTNGSVDELSICTISGPWLTVRKQAEWAIQSIHCPQEVEK
jgi:hypothetical protein